VDRAELAFAGFVVQRAGDGRHAERTHDAMGSVTRRRPQEAVEIVQRGLGSVFGALSHAEYRLTDDHDAQLLHG
jgi:hypothetical protein